MAAAEEPVWLNHVRLRANVCDTHVWVALTAWEICGCPGLQGRTVDAHLTLLYLVPGPPPSSTAIVGAGSSAPSSTGAGLSAPLEGAGSSAPYIQRVISAMDEQVSRFLRADARHHFSGRFSVSPANAEGYGIVDVLVTSPIYAAVQQIVVAGIKAIPPNVKPPRRPAQFHISVRPWDDVKSGVLNDVLIIVDDCHHHRLFQLHLCHHCHD